MLLNRLISFRKSKVSSAIPSGLSFERVEPIIDICFSGLINMYSDELNVSDDFHKPFS